MRKTQIFVLIAILGIATTAGSAEVRTLSIEVESAALKVVQLEAGVGDVDITVGSGSLIIASVELRPRRGGLFSSLKEAEKQVQAIKLEPRVTGDTLELTLEGVDEDRRFEEDWTLTLPSHLALSIELGVGNIEVSSASGGLDLELGVGNATIRVLGGPVEIEVGVGDITVHGAAAAYRSVEIAAGVGDVRILAEGQKIIGEGFIAHSAEWRGSGDSDLEAESGVGDIRVVLE